MKTVRCLLITLLCLLSVRATPATKDFTLPADQPKISGYAEIVRETQYSSGHRYPLQAHIWFQGRRRWRVESTTSFIPELYYQICSGRYAYAGLTRKRHHDILWISTPRSRIEDNIDPYVGPTWTIANPTLVGRGVMYGLPVEHWHGKSRLGKSTLDVWVSIDPRYPLMLRAQSRSARGYTSWSITKLDLTSPVPGYIFTEQAVPKPGFLRLLLLPHRSPLITVLWNALILLAYAGVLFPLAWRMNARWLALRIAIAVMSLAVWCFLNMRSPRLEAYLLTFWGLPVIAGIALLCFAFVILSLRLIGRPTGASVFKGTTCAVILMVPIAIALGMLTQYPFQRSMLKFVRSSFELAPPAIIGSVLMATGWAAVEELIFRGYLFSALSSRLKSAYLVVLIQAAIFAVYHVPGRLQLANSSLHFAFDMAWLAVFGIIFGILRLRYRNLGVPWLVHAGFNTGYIFLFYSGLTGILNAHF